MSLFDRIRDKIFRRDAEHSRPGTPASARGQASQPRSRSSATQQHANSASAAHRGSESRPAEPASATQVDVEDVLESLASQEGQELNWRTSIVDLMKLVDLDPSLSNRQELAKELGYAGSMDDSASMNIWLHKQVMRKLAENGGKVPASLRD
jgi:hypothetical protein